MNTVKINIIPESEIIRIPELKDYIGKNIEITIRETKNVVNIKYRPIGIEKGKIKMAEDFNSPLPEELLKEFYK